MSDDRDDDELTAQLRELLADPMPDDLLQISDGLFSWRTIDAELAELAQESDALSGVRAAGSITAFTFTTADRVIEVEFDSDSRELVIDLGGTWADGLQLLRPDGSTTEVAIDEAGVARSTGLAAGAVQLVVTPRVGGQIKTEWVTI